MKLMHTTPSLLLVDEQLLSYVEHDMFLFYYYNAKPYEVECFHVQDQK